MPGVEVHANVVAGILENRIPFKPAYLLGAEFIFYLLLCVLMSFLPNLLSPLSNLALSFTFAIAITIGNFLHGAKVLYSLFSPIFIISIYFMFHMSSFSLNQEANRLLPRYLVNMSPELVDELVINQRVFHWKVKAKN